MDSRLRKILEFDQSDLKRLIFIEVDNGNSQHKHLFIKELFRINAKILGTFQLTGDLEFMCNYNCLNDES